MDETPPDHQSTDLSTQRQERLQKTKRASYPMPLNPQKNAGMYAEIKSFTLPKCQSSLFPYDYY